MKRDKIIFDLIGKEQHRQLNGIELIASENFTSPQVMKAMGSVLTNKYAEGLPGKRYYAGCEVVDEVETIAIERIKTLFGASWANVQPHSGAQANAAEARGKTSEKKEKAAKEPKAKKEKAVKEPKAPKVAAKKTTRKKVAKEARLKAYWGVFNQSMKRLALYEHSDRKAADKKAAELVQSSRASHFVQLVKEAITE